MLLPREEQAPTARPRAGAELRSNSHFEKILPSQRAGTLTASQGPSKDPGGAGMERRGPVARPSSPLPNPCPPPPPQHVGSLGRCCQPGTRCLPACSVFCKHHAHRGRGLETETHGPCCPGAQRLSSAPATASWGPWPLGSILPATPAAGSESMTGCFGLRVSQTSFVSTGCSEGG